MRRFLLALVCFGFCFSCSRSDTHLARYHQDGRLKPAVVVTPMFSSVEVPYSWNVAEELTTAIENITNTSRNLYMQKQGLPAFSPTVLLKNASEIATVLPSPSGYYVLSELIGYERFPYKRGAVKPVYPTDGKEAYTVAITVRLHVVAVRHGEATTVLQEIVRTNHAVSEHHAKEDLSTKQWGSSAYDETFVALMHRRVADTVAHRVEEYVLINNTL